MVGGKVIDVYILQERVWINCQDKRNTCAIYVENSPKAQCIEEGDQLWWQGGQAFWTPQQYVDIPESELQCDKHYDIRLKRIGYSGVNDPRKKSNE